MTVSRVAIVGAGISGITCANKLLEAGVSVTLFDKGRKLGGRLASRDRDEYTFDYGAQYFTARDERFKTFVNELVERGSVSVWHGRFARSSDGVLHPESVKEQRYVGVPLMRSLADASLSRADDFLTSHRVTGVGRQSGKWWLTGIVQKSDGADETTFTRDGYDFLVLTLPPAQSAALHANAQVASISFRPCIALLHAYPERVDIEFDGIIMDDEMISWCARDSSKPGRGPGERWVIHASPDWSERHFDMTEDELKNLLADRYATIFGARKLLHDALFSKLHKWRYALPVSPPPGCIVDREAALLYCGDWSLGARVEAGFLSGIAAAEEIMRINPS